MYHEGIVSVPLTAASHPILLVDTSWKPSKLLGLTHYIYLKLITIDCCKLQVQTVFDMFDTNVCSSVIKASKSSNLHNKGRHRFGCFDQRGKTLTQNIDCVPGLFQSDLELSESMLASNLVQVATVSSSEIQITCTCLNTLPV